MPGVELGARAAPGRGLEDRVDAELAPGQLSRSVRPAFPDEPRFCPELGRPRRDVRRLAARANHYPAKLCLVQVADNRGQSHLIDPLALPTLTPLGSFFADPGVLKVLHAADNDLGYLKRLYGFTVANIFDTAIAARFLGAKALGLDVLLGTYLGVELPPSRQRDDWSRRPLSEAQRRYAESDVLHLFALKARLTEELERVGRHGGRRRSRRSGCAARGRHRHPPRCADARCATSSGPP